MSAITISEFNGLPALELHAGDGSRGTVLLQGAQLLSWIPAGKGEQLYLSPAAVFDGKTAIRGGVPVIFPQFDQLGPLPKHGFARNRSWRPLSVETGASDVLTVLRLVSDGETMAAWPHRFVAELSISLSATRLDIELAIDHRDPEEGSPPLDPLRFTAALHSYFRVADAANATLEGLQRLRYFDKVRSTEQVDAAPLLVVTGELDRVYFDVATPVTLRDGARRLAIANHGFDDVVVWNPGSALSERIADLPDGGWREMLCVEAASIGQPVEVRPGECWIGRQTVLLLDETAAT